jgi:transcriptional regulator with XRE-family HTH domain
MSARGISDTTRTIADRVRAIRKDLGLAAEQLAAAMTAQGIPWQRSIVANLENGRRESVSVDELIALSAVLGVAPDELAPELKLSPAVSTTDERLARLERMVGELRAEARRNRCDGT